LDGIGQSFDRMEHIFDDLMNERGLWAAQRDDEVHANSCAHDVDVATREIIASDVHLENLHAQANDVFASDIHLGNLRAQPIEVIALDVHLDNFRGVWAVGIGSLEDRRRSRACWRIEALTPGAYEWKGKQCVDENWDFDHFLDFWIRRMFDSNLVDLISAEAFMHKVWYEECDDFLSTFSHLCAGEDSEA
jgi:hypothetical protein